MITVLLNQCNEHIWKLTGLSFEDKRGPKMCSVLVLTRSEAEEGHFITKGVQLIN